jgi:hypothetical protein
MERQGLLDLTATKLIDSVFTSGTKAVACFLA